MRHKKEHSTSLNKYKILDCISYILLTCEISTIIYATDELPPIKKKINHGKKNQSSFQLKQFSIFFLLAYETVLSFNVTMLCDYRSYESLRKNGPVYQIK